MAIVNAGAIRQLSIKTSGDKVVLERSGSERRLDQRTYEGIKAKWPDAVVKGHPALFFEPGFLVYTEKDRVRRSLDLCPIPGGGTILQSCWYEDGQIALSFLYRPDLAMKKCKYIDVDGKEVEGIRLVHRTFAHRLVEMCKAFLPWIT